MFRLRYSARRFDAWHVHVTKWMATNTSSTHWVLPTDGVNAGTALDYVHIHSHHHPSPTRSRPLSLSHTVARVRVKLGHFLRHRDREDEEPDTCHRRQHRRYEPKHKLIICRKRARAHTQVRVCLHTLRPPSREASIHPRTHRNRDVAPFALSSSMDRQDRMPRWPDPPPPITEAATNQ